MSVLYILTVSEIHSPGRVSLRLSLQHDAAASVHMLITSRRLHSLSIGETHQESFLSYVSWRLSARRASARRRSFGARSSRTCSATRCRTCWKASAPRKWVLEIMQFGSLRYRYTQHMHSCKESAWFMQQVSCIHNYVLLNMNVCLV